MAGFDEVAQPLGRVLVDLVVVDGHKKIHLVGWLVWLGEQGAYCVGYSGILQGLVCGVQFAPQVLASVL